MIPAKRASLLLLQHSPALGIATGSRLLLQAHQFYIWKMVGCNQSIRSSADNYNVSVFRGSWKWELVTVPELVRRPPDDVPAIRANSRLPLG